MAPAWHDSFHRMKQRPHVLVVCPQAVGEAWRKVIEGVNAGSFTPWRHQIEAAAWARGRQAAMLALDMGTGKTLTAILATLEDRRDLVPLILTDGPTARRAATLDKAMAEAHGRPIIAVVNYDSVWRGDLAKAIEKVKWQAIVLDESHRIKAPNGTASKWLARLASGQPLARRLCLTGTPMPHSPLDLFGQFRFMDKEIFGGSFFLYRRRFAECDTRFPSKVRRWLRQEELSAILDAHSWRVSADEVLDLPEAIHERIPVTLTGATRRFYSALERDMTAEIESGTVTAANALTELLRLQQATGGYTTLDAGGGGPRPAPTPIDSTLAPDKRLALGDRLSDLPEPEPVVVFARFRSDLAEIEALCREMGRPYAELSGSRNNLAAWQAGEATVLGVQMQSGSVGIDLTRAAYAFYYSVGFSLGEYEQSLARLRRPGQGRCVRYYHLVASGTVDEEVYAALQERRDVVDAVLRGLSPRIEEAA